MKYIQQFSQNKLHYYIYKLNKGDSIIHIILDNYYKNNIFIILKGVIYKQIILKNEEILSIGIFNTDHIIKMQDEYHYKNRYYKLTALEITYIMSIQYEELYRKENSTILQNLLKSYNLTLQRYEEMNYIINHKYNTDKVLQLILFLCRKFGKFHNKRIIIPLFLTKKQIADILGCNTTIINDTIKMFNSHIYVYKNKKLIILTDLFFSIASKV